MAKRFVCKVAEIIPGHSRSFVVDGKKVFIASVDGALKAYVNSCPHMGGSLHYNGRNIKCNWHGALFDPKTGTAMTAPALDGTGLEAIPLVVEGDDIYYEEVEKERSPWADDFS